LEFFKLIFPLILIAIESALEKALYKCGMISDSNFGFLDKIGWSRSSRTDKGVHAAGVVVSLKMLIDGDSEEILDEHVQSVNEALPSDIRVFSIQRTRKSFLPRRAQLVRKYEYYVPKEFLKSPPSEHVLQMFNGRHSFHNFTRRKRALENDLQKTFPDIELDKFDGFQIEALQFMPQSFYTRFVESVKCDPIVVNGSEYYCFTFKGESFLYHQIRKMVGILLAVCNYKLDKEIIDISLKYPFRTFLPLAPARPLTLVFEEESFFNGRLGYDDLPAFSTESVIQSLHRFKLDHICREICTSDLLDEFTAWQSDHLDFHATRIAKNTPLLQHRVTEYKHALESVNQQRTQVPRHLYTHWNNTISSATAFQYYGIDQQLDDELDDTLDDDQ
jgi:tRNA pseudouridine38-40 synthase